MGKLERFMKKNAPTMLTIIGEVRSCNNYRNSY